MAQSRYPVNKETVRPFRLWDPLAGKGVPYRYYSDARRAHNAALIELRWSKVGRVIEVIDITHVNKLLGQYIRRVNDLAFMDSRNAIRSRNDLEKFMRPPENPSGTFRAIVQRPDLH